MMFRTSSYYRVNCESMKSSRMIVVKFVGEENKFIIEEITDDILSRMDREKNLVG